MTPAGVEPATFRFVAQQRNHCATAVPNNNNNNNNNKSIQTRTLSSRTNFSLHICSSRFTFQSTLYNYQSTHLPISLSHIPSDGRPNPVDAFAYRGKVKIFVPTVRYIAFSSPVKTRDIRRPKPNSARHWGRVR